MKQTKETKKLTSFLSMLLVVTLVLTMSIAGLTLTVSAADTAPTDAWSTYAADDFEGGTGTEESPYLIATEEQLAKLSVDVAGGEAYKGKWFKLMNDLDLSAHRWNPIGQYKWESNGDTTHNNFSGNFDGNGKTISGIYVDETTDGFSGGLFGCITNSASASDSILQIEIRDLTVEDAVIYGNEEGLFQGYNGILGSYVSAGIDRNILIENVHVSGSLNITCIYGNYSVGGMVGYADNVTFTNCTVDDIYQRAATNSGGFVGIDDNCTYTDCLARGTVYGSWAMGGFVGYTTLQDSTDGSTHSTFTRCVADVDVISNDWNVGGFVGLSVGGVFTDCAALGDVESQVTGWEPRVGGFAGHLEPYYDSYNNPPTLGPYPSVLTNCYFGGKVRSAHATIQPSALVASVTEDATITGCSYDAEKNPDMNVFSQANGTAVASFTATAFTTDEAMNIVCDSLYGHHQYVGSTCKVCGLEQVYVNADGYWVIDGTVTNVQAAGEKGDKGDTGEQGIQGEKGDTGAQGIQGEKGDTGTAGSDGKDGVDGKDGADGLTVAATVIGSTALASNIALIAYTLIKKKRLF